MSEIHLLQRPVVGVSACLLGQPVRYDGGDKRNDFICGPLATCFDYQPICPEAAIGLGVPRPTIRLVGDWQRPRLQGVLDPSRDVTDAMEHFAQQQLPGLAHLSGYVLKKDSPSCGMERVRVYPPDQPQPLRKGQGVFARLLMQHYPLLPVEEEGRLNDPVLRENFVNRVYALHRWQQLQQQGLTASTLLEFHTRHKYLLMAHSQAAYQRMGRLLAQLAGADLTSLASGYLQELMTALSRRVTPARHVNVLQHILGYLKRSIDAADKQELTGAIEAYRRGEVPLVVPITLLKHYFRRFPDPYISQQIYLQPHPEALGLRNGI